MHNSRHTLRTYQIGFVSAVLLTVIPFTLVRYQVLPSGMLLPVIAALAVLQVGVHFRFFLGMRVKSSTIEELVSLAFALTLIVLLVGGSVWIMSDLSGRMMP
ncbi:MAG: cytochrome o ubiquinol oxidase subunit IV [Pseudomonadales bacterium]